MPRFRIVVLLVVALGVTAVCVRLGIWQLDRLAERRSANARTAATLRLEPAEVGAITVDSAAAGRRVRVRGTYDYDRELVLVNRSRAGAPGINLVTPLRIPAADTAVLVNRGWVYSPDGASVDRALWREASEASGIGYVLWPTAGSPGTPSPIDSTRRVRRVDPDRIAASLPYPVARYHVVLLADSITPANGASPERLEPPPLDEGPHTSYAIQWFSFATIVVVGTAALLWKERTA